MELLETSEQLKLKTMEKMSEGKVLDDETDQLLEDLPIGVILGLGEEETPTLEMLLDATTQPPIEERGGAMQVVASQ